MMYQSLRETVNSKSKLIPVQEDVYKFVTDINKDWYVSLYQYTEEQKKQVDATGSVAGLKDTSTNRLVWDFDNKEDIELARQDALTLAKRLIEKGFASSSISAFYTGCKGYSIEAKIDQRITPEQFKAVTSTLAGDLPTFDKVVNDPNRIIRLPNTKHKVSGLYKIQLTPSELKMHSNAIKELAIAPKDLIDTTPSILPSDLLLKPVSPVKIEMKDSLEDINWNAKPKWLTNCKYALLNGHFIKGQRNNSLTILAATLKGQGFNKDHIYSALKSANRLYGGNGGEPLDKVEIYNIAHSVSQVTWRGGIYSCRQPGALQDFCNGLGEHKCKHNEGSTVSADEVFSLFNNYAENYEKNLIFTGIESLDEKMRLLVGTSNALLAPPGVGKTSLSLELLNHNSKENNPSLFFSYDMFHSALYLRMIQRHTGYSQDKIFDLFKHDKKEMNKIKEVLKREYDKVKFCFKAGQSIEELENTILDTQEKTGEKIKLVVVDYNELVSTNLTDSTASSAMVAQKLRQIANEREVAIMTLLQPSKIYSSPSDEITNYNSAKGSSAIAQSVSLMLGCSRPGFNPRGNTDKFFNITCLKNRNGALFTLDFTWDGLTGRIGELSDEDRIELEELRQQKAAEKASENKGWG